MERHIGGAVTPRNVRAASGGLVGLLRFLWKPPSHHVRPQQGGHGSQAGTLTPAEFRQRAAEMFPEAHEAGKAAARAVEEARVQQEARVDLKAAAERGRQQAKEDFQRILRSP